MKRISKILSLLLSVILTAQLLLLPAVGEQALDVSEPSGVISAGQSPGTKVTAEPYEVGEEIEAWREDGVKH